MCTHRNLAVSCFSLSSLVEFFFLHSFVFQEFFLLIAFQEGLQEYPFLSLVGLALRRKKIQKVSFSDSFSWLSRPATRKESFRKKLPAQSLRHILIRSSKVPAKSRPCKASAMATLARWWIARGSSLALSNGELSKNRPPRRSRPTKCLAVTW